MNTLPHVEAHMEHYNDLRREADHVRLVREARQSAAKRNPILRPALYWLRCRLMSIVHALSRKYSEVRPTPTWKPSEQPVIKQSDC